MAGIVASITLSIILKPALGLFSNDSQLIEMALRYGTIRTLFLPIMFTSFTVNTVLRCSGDSKTPMYIAIFTSVLNIILDPILMFKTIPFIGLPGFGLGIFGAALATVISVTISLLGGLWVLLGPKSKFSLKLSEVLTIDWKIALRIVQIGFPPAFSGLLRTLTNLIILGFVSIYGVAAVAAWGIISRLCNLLWMPINGIKQGGSAIVGQSIGGGLFERAEKTGLTAGKLGFVAMVVLSAIMFIFSSKAIELFTNDLEVITLGATALRMTIFSLPIIGLYSGVSSMFLGSGYTLPFLLAGIIGQWLFQMPMLLLVVKVWQLSFSWVAASSVILAIGEGLVYLYFYYKGTWREKIKADMVTTNTVFSN